MGIPLHWEPPADRKDATTKAEPPAGRRHRSSIRRSTYGRAPRVSGQSPGGTSARYLPSPLSLEESWGRAASERESRRNARTSGDPANSEEWNPSSASIAAGINSRAEMGRRILRESMRYSTPRHRLRSRRAQAYRVEPDSFGPARDWPHHPATLPPGPAPEPTVARSVRRVSLTPRFAPAHPAAESDSPTSATSTPAPNRSSDRPDANMPLLRRVGHQSVADAANHGSGHNPLIDGLGDRERSFGPDDMDDPGDDYDDEMHNTWETLLTTIQPDTQLPSAGSSFDSATATASSALSRRSGLSNSMTASHTPPSSFGSASSRFAEILEPFPEFTTNCDFGSSSDGSDTEAESDQERGPYQRSTSVTRRRGERTRPNPDTREDPGRQQRGRPQGAEPAEPAEQSAATSFATSFSGDGHLSELQHFLDHLARRDDIPDEWWETAGLSRTIRRELNDT